MQQDRFEEYRSPSPWDRFSVSPGEPALDIQLRAGDGIPKLVPEIEQGNVEYKLKLINPTPERFNRLVTQLNWRIMEGNGQALYQLGVADSGQLVGLTKVEMEATLETLEAMAGEIGASVLINREIEVSARLLTGVGGITGSSWWRNRRSRSSNLPSSLASTSASASPLVNGTLQLPRSRGGPSSGTPTSVTETESSETEETPSSVEEEEEELGDAIETIEEGGNPDATLTDCDPDEIIVRSAPIPITHAMLRRPFTTGDGSYPGSADMLGITGSGGNADNDSDGEDLGVFGLGDLDLSAGGFAAAKPRPKVGPDALPKRKATIKPSKGKRPPNPFISPQTQEEIAAKAASKRAKRDQRRAERKRAMVGPGPSAKPFPTPGEAKVERKALTVEAVEALTTALTNVSLLSASPPAATTAQERVETAAMTDASTIKAADDDTTVVVVPVERRLIVEALVVRKAGLGNGYVDLSRFDEEINQLPSFSLG